MFQNNILQMHSRSQNKKENDTSTHEYVNRSQTLNMPTSDFSEIERTQRPDASKSNLTNTLPTNNTSTLHSFPSIEYTINRFFRNQKFEYERARLYKFSDQSVRFLFKQKRNAKPTMSNRIQTTPTTGTHHI